MINHTNYIYHTFGGIYEIHRRKVRMDGQNRRKGTVCNSKEAREIFDFQPGAEILVLGDVKRGIAILPREQQEQYISKIFADIEQTDSDQQGGTDE